ncbi:MAG: nucleotide exchange factor GrpE [Planctomycetota bacterium]
MSKKDPARTDPADRPQPAEIEPGPQAAVDRAAEALPDTDQQTFGQQQRLGDGDGQTANEIDRLRAELEEAKDQTLRIRAELENYRKRAARQMQEELRYANMPLIRDLLPVWDNVGRAIEAAEKTHETASLLEGFKMVAGQLESVLERHHCTRIEALEEPFDPNLHEAICQQPSRAHPANTVLQVTQTGFRLHDRVVRPSQVIVSAAVPETTAPEEGPESGEQED